MKKYKRNENFVYEEAGEEMIILDHKNGKIYTLNRTAKEIWKYLEKERSLNDVCVYMEQKYNKNDIRKEEIRDVVKKLS